MSYVRPADTGLPHPADGCPKCNHGYGVVPYDVIQTDREGIRCWYRCPRCRHSWWTSWGMRGDEWHDVHNFPDEHGQRECPCGCPGVMRLEADPFDAALEVAMEAIKNGASKAEAAMIFARAHCAAYGCPGCFEEGTTA